MLRSTSSRLVPVGFIGLGQMGGRMAPNLFKSDLVTELHYYDAAGAAPVDSPLTEGKKLVKHANAGDVAAACKHLVTMLPNGTIVRDVYTNSVLPKLQKGSVLVDCSTVDPQTPKDIGDAALKAGADAFCDAPVSGGVNAAGAGTLTFLVGGPSGNKAAFENGGIEAMLKAMGKNIFRCGDVGAGQVVKLANNLILAQHMVAVSEAMLLGSRLGVDPKVLASCVNASTGRCWTSELYNPFPGVCPEAPASKGYAGGFGAQLMLKDVKLAIDAAKTVDLPVTGAGNAAAEYTALCEKADLKGLDFGAMLKFLDGKK